jgi:hypothetical protein
MNMTQRTLTGVVACALAIGGPAAVMAAGAGDDKGKDVTLTGCLVKGEGDGAGYLLSNAPAMPSVADRRSSKVEPSTVGTAGSFEPVFYWLDGDHDLAKNIGHRIEVKGSIKGDVKDGEIELDRKDRWTEMTVKSDGRTMKANVPNASVFPDPATGKDEKGHVLVRLVDVEHVKMLGASCEP